MRILIFILTLLPFSLLAQDALKVTYGQQITFTTKENPNESEEHREALRRAMEEINYFELILLENEANYLPIEKIRNEQPTEGHTYSISFGAPDQKVYINYDEGIRIRTNTMYGQYNIIKSELPNKNWEITRETKEILGIAVRKAVNESEKVTETAWYAPSLPYKAGPDDNWGLPGLILEYKSIVNTGENNKRTTHLFANNIETLQRESVALFIPDESKSITEEAYYEMVDFHNKRFKEMYNQGVNTSD